MLPPMEFSTGNTPWVALPWSTASNTCSKALAGQQVGVVDEAKRGGLAIGPRLALIGDAHSPDRVHHRLSTCQNG